MNTMTTTIRTALDSYVPAPWVTDLPVVPKWKVKLAMTPTPIHRWHLPGIPDDVQIYIKRDDMTGSVLSGNKVRKLEFLLADALATGCRHVITIGGGQSNHCRATAIAARQLGLQPHLVLLSDAEQPGDLGCHGNMFLNRLVNAKVYVVPKASVPSDAVSDWLKAFADKIESETGESVYPIVTGGSTEYGVYAYMDVFKELLDQDAASRFDDVIVASGSGGTIEGLSIGNHLSGAGLKIHGVTVYKDSHFIYERLNEKLKTFRITDVVAQDIHHAIDGHKGIDYGISTQDEMDFVFDVAAQTGVILDPVYTGKAVKGLVHDLIHNRDRFKGNRILFIHTGGIFGMCDGRVNESLVQRTNQNIQFLSSIGDVNNIQTS